MKKITVKCCNDSAFLRSNAFSKAIDFEFRYAEYKFGAINGVLYAVETNKGEFQIYIYQTKTSIIADVRKV